MFGGNFGGSSRKGRNRGSVNIDEYSEDITLKYEIDFNESVNGSSKVIYLINLGHLAEEKMHLQYLQGNKG